MSQKNSSVLRLLSIVMITSLGFFGCVNPKEMSGFRGAVIQEEERSTRDTEEAVRESSLLQELDRLCRQEIPIPEGFVLVYKNRGRHEKTFISYYYYSEIDYKKVRNFYKDYFIQNGWQLTDQKDGGWGPDRLRFQREKYEVQIYHGGMGRGVTYSLTCMKLSDSDESTSSS